MTDELPNDVSGLIEATRAGDAVARQRLFELVYDHLRDIARQRRYVGAYGHTLQPTALANEAFLLLFRRLPLPAAGQPADEAAFFRAVTRATRTILRDHWRQQTAKKRGGARQPAHLEQAPPADPVFGAFEQIDFLALDETLDELERYNKRWFEVVMHRYFAGRSIEETARLLEVGVSTVKSDWQLARAWLRREIDGAGP